MDHCDVTCHMSLESKLQAVVVTPDKIVDATIGLDQLRRCRLNVRFQYQLRASAS